MTLRVGVLVPDLSMNGVTRWVCSLAKWLPNHEALLVAVGIPPAAEAKQTTAYALSSIGVPLYGTTVYNEHGENSDHVLRLGEDLEQVVDRVFEYSDVVIIYSLSDCAQIFRHKRPTKPVILVSHGPSEYTASWIRELYPFSSGNVAVSSCCVFDFPTEIPVEIIHNGYEPDRVATVPYTLHERVRLRQDLFDVVDPHQLVIGYVGRFSDEKNILDIARAVAWINECTDSSAIGVWVGQGYAQRRYEVLAEEIAGPNACLWLPPTEDVASIFKAIDVFMLTSYREGFSMALLEAWASHVPTVSTGVGATPSLQSVFQKSLTHLVPLDIPEEKKGQVLGLACLKASADTHVRRNAYEVTVKYLTADKMAERWANYLRKVLSTASAS